MFRSSLSLLVVVLVAAFFLVLVFLKFFRWILSEENFAIAFTLAFSLVSFIAMVTIVHSHGNNRPKHRTLTTVPVLSLIKTASLVSFKSCVITNQSSSAVKLGFYVPQGKGKRVHTKQSTSHPQYDSSKVRSSSLGKRTL